MKRSVLFVAFTVNVLLFYFVSFSLGDKNRVWDDSLYDTFTLESFKTYNPANRSLDFKDVDYPLLHAAIFFEINRVRALHGKTPFLHSKALEKAAVSHSREMVAKDFFSHASPLSTEKGSIAQRWTSFGVKAQFIAENIAVAFGLQYREGSPISPPARGGEPFRGSRTGKVIPHHTYNSFAGAVVEKWMRSPGHKANILNEKLKFLGSGARYFEDRKFHNMPTFKVTLDMASQAPE